MIRTFGLLLYLNGLFLLLYSHVEIIKKEKKPFSDRMLLFSTTGMVFKKKNAKRRIKMLMINFCKSYSKVALNKHNPSLTFAPKRCF